MAQQLRELGNPLGQDIWKQQTPGALGNNAMAVAPHAQPASDTPGWMKSLGNIGQTVVKDFTTAPSFKLNRLVDLGQGMVNGIAAPGNALMGKYDQAEIGPNGSVSPVDPRMIGDASTLAGLVTLGSGAMPAEAGALNMGIKAYHGSPHSFDAFADSAIGTGEGAQAYGRGHYFAENETVAQGYRDQISGNSAAAANAAIAKAKNNVDAAISATQAKLDKLSRSRQSGWRDGQILDHQSLLQQLNEVKATGSTNSGSVYHVDINAEPSQMLDWDKPLSAQSPAVQKALGKLDPDMWHPNGSDYDPQETGSMIYQRLASKGGHVDAAAALHSAGIPGISYLDSVSRITGKGTRNHVVFDPKNITILKKYGIAAPVAGGAIASGMQQNSLMQPTPQLPPPNPLVTQINM